MESPCTLVCSIDTKTGYCFGCGRTGTEIGGWTLYTTVERRDIMAGLATRMETMEHKPHRETRSTRLSREELAREKASGE